MTHDQVVAGIEAALGVGAVTADVVAVEARRHAATDTAADVSGAATEAVTFEGGVTAGRHTTADRGAHPRRAEHHDHQRIVSLTQRRLTDPAAVIAGLPPDLRPVPSVAAYDELLPRRRPLTPNTSDTSEPAAAPAAAT
jgi:hypothetical protein